MDAIKKNTVKIVSDYFALREELFSAFGYAENWAAIPLRDDTASWWWLSGDGSGDFVIYGDGAVKKAIAAEEYYRGDVYTQRHLPRWVYRTATHTMICLDTGSDLNRVLGVFLNTKEVVDPKLVALIQDNA